MTPRAFQREPRHELDRLYRREIFDPSKHSREALVGWVRANAPDLRIGYAIIDEQRRAFARFTFAGVAYDRGADDEDALAREIATVMARLLRVPVRLDRGDTLALERQVLEAAATGNTDAADTLGRQLAMRNAGAVPTRIHNRFQR